MIHSLFEKKEKKVEYIELIYDLIFVYVIGRNNALLHHIENGFVPWTDFLYYVVCTLAIIQIWNYTTYYINAYGYWDTLVVQANTAESDAVKRLTNERTYDNRQHYNRGKWNYANELTHRYSFNTAWLTEDQSLLMHHLLNSPLVYLHDVTKGEIHPIVLVDTSTEYKRDGKGLYQYSFVAELAQERVRR